MKTLVILGLALSTTFIQAETLKDRIHSIEDGIVKFQNGRVAFVNSSIEGLETNALITAQLDDDSNLLSFKKISEIPNQRLPRAYVSALRTEDETAPEAFTPTVLPNMAAVQKIYDNSNPYYKRISECTDRAHVWAHDEFKRSGTKSRKAFVFFTASYINSVGFKWWFHVAPMYSVNVNGKIVDMVTDFRYMSGPATVKQWTDAFVYTKRPCKMTTKFSEYDVNPQTENCYLIYESMHYKIPGDIHNQELHGTYKTSTSESEVNFSRRLAFEL